MMKLISSLCLLLAVTGPALAQSGSVEIRKVMDLFQNQQFDEVINYLTPIERQEPNNIEVLGYLGYANYMNDNYKASRKFYERVVNSDSENIQALRYLADMTASKAPDSSLMFNRRLIHLQPKVAAHYRNTGEILRRSKERDSALVYFQKAYNLMPSDPKNGLAFADMLITKKMFGKADSIIQNGLKQDSLNIAFLRLAVKSGYDSENFLACVAPGETLIRLEEPAVSALTQLVLSYYNLKKYQDSYRVCQWLIEEGLNSEVVYFYQSKAAAKLKNYEESNDLLRTSLAIAVSTTAEQYYYNLAQNYEALKDYKKAIKHYDTAYYLFRDPNMMYYIASVYETHLKDQNQAKKYYLKFLATAKPRNANELKAVQYVRERWGGNVSNDSIVSSRKKDEE